ncbi:disulfide bond corrector protein DsbC [Sphingobacterium allocomposti]|uniref:Disulfide bond corrector protein DsbC n=1 Tax=Sphingobacterium allocomposti TaxID=415956 RepID=A0A5S5DR69_9SPHI|nr:protein-disulfide reductase DsbD domain-containing protein [Sphingobacterium composti Yoo et al. 2007 non Ten et al. 2007]TYP98387.1 disulfide bond corrector protein DsbC [Sphingobacterium composti Yoo et al. 2007 non Ten et al. 2007]
MKKIGFLILVMTVTMLKCSIAQIYNPVKWSVAAKKLNSKEAVVFVKAVIQDGWHIYGLDVPEGGPLSTKLSFSTSPAYALNGKVAAPAPKSKYEKDFKMDVPYYPKEVVFQQRVKLIKGEAMVKGTVEFMACDKTQCLPPDEYNFSVAIK